MPLFSYKAKSASGELKTGRLEAKNEKDLLNSLRKQVLAYLCLVGFL